MNEGQSGLQARVELLANLCTIVLALVAVAVILGRGFAGHADALAGRAQPSPPIAAAFDGPKIGTTIDIPGVNPAEADRTLVFVLSTRCRFCTQSVPFYARVAAAVRDKPRVRLVAALADSRHEVSTWLRNGGANPAEWSIVEADASSLRAPGTPTLILVDRSGTVTQTWRGLLTPDGERNVIQSLVK